MGMKVEQRSLKIFAIGFLKYAIQRSFSHSKNESNSPTGQSISFLPPSLESDAIANTIKSFFPAEPEPSSSSAMEFQIFQSPDFISRTSCNLANTQDLRLSLQSFQDPVLLHHHSRLQLSRSPWFCQVDREPIFTQRGTLQSRENQEAAKV
ncbi:TCP transcription factor [Striga asiatica]|uniref:TCP transcription factor n=1 Tax=Striga asiatica TaxID=4170 RepID=A0A5A7QGN9_STRAF|nr:TCP transcription factor [Striga asiatica]